MTLGTHDNQHPRPFQISYVRGAHENCVSDSARTIEAAVARINARLEKPHNRTETGEVWHFGQVVYVADRSGILYRGLTP